MGLRGTAAIIGVGSVKPERRMPNRSGIGVAAEAGIKAVRDAGLRRVDIDGLITQMPGETPTALAEYLGLRPTWSHGVVMEGATGTTSVTLAAMALDAGLAKNVLVVIGGLAPGGDMPTEGGSRLREQFDAPFGPASGATGWYAMIANRYAHEYGLTDEQRAAVAVQQRENAHGNPNAIFRGIPLTVEDVVTSRMISTPLRLLECVMPTGGAEAVLMTSADRARSGPQEPVYLLGSGMAVDHYTLGGASSLTTSPVAISARRAFEMAGLGPRDMDMVSLYDCYTITVLISLEDAGFVPKGEAGAFVESTDITYKGELPVNTHGGQLSYGQPMVAGGMSHVTESVLQMQGRAGERQVEKLDYCFVNG